MCVRVGIVFASCQTHFLGNEKQIDVDGSVNTLEVPDLRALSKYQLQLRAMNAIGTSDPYTVTFFTSGGFASLAQLRLPFSCV